MAQSATRAAVARSELTARSRTLLKPAIMADKERRRAFLQTISDETVAAEIETDPQAFADCLSFALTTNLVDQYLLADRIGYVTSQVGRWAAGKAVPPLLVRRGVVAELAVLVKESLATLR